MRDELLSRVHTLYSDRKEFRAKSIIVNQSKAVLPYCHSQKPKGKDKTILMSLLQVCMIIKLDSLLKMAVSFYKILNLAVLQFLHLWLTLLLTVNEFTVSLCKDLVECFKYGYYLKSVAAHD